MAHGGSLKVRVAAGEGGGESWPPASEQLTVQQINRVNLVYCIKLVFALEDTDQGHAMKLPSSGRDMGEYVGRSRQSNLVELR